jgi:hypothetical protein
MATLDGSDRYSEYEFQFGTFTKTGPERSFTRPPNALVEAHTPAGDLGHIAPNWYWWGRVFSGVETCLPNLFNCQRRVTTGTEWRTPTATAVRSNSLAQLPLRRMSQTGKYILPMSARTVDDNVTAT